MCRGDSLQVGTDFRPVQGSPSVLFGRHRHGVDDPAIKWRADFLDPAVCGTSPISGY
jgi:hypothetical protein